MRDPGDRVPAGHVQPGVRAALLEDDAVAGLVVVAEVDAAAVGELDDAVDRVRQVVGGDRVARVEMRLQERRQRHPRRHRERRTAVVRDQPALVVLEGEHPLAGRRQAVPADEGAVPDEERAFAVAQIAQDVRAADASEDLVELLEHELAAGPRPSGRS